VTALSELYTALTEVCENVAYGAFLTKPETPFIVYRVAFSDDVYADDTNFVPVSVMDIALVNDTKDSSLEASLEDELSALGLTWEKSESYNTSDRLVEVVYAVEVMLHETEGDSSG
jgi:hypothetical protein